MATKGKPELKKSPIVQKDPSEGTTKQDIEKHKHDPGYDPKEYRDG